jgi:hypothetical protein
MAPVPPSSKIFFIAASFHEIKASQEAPAFDHNIKTGAISPPSV